MVIVGVDLRGSLFWTRSLIVQQSVAQLARPEAKTAMPRSTHIPIGVPAGLPERLCELETWKQGLTALDVDGFGSRNPDAAQAWPHPAIPQRRTGKLHWGHTTRVLGWVKGRHRGPGRSHDVLLGRADSGPNQ